MKGRCDECSEDGDERHSGCPHPAGTVCDGHVNERRNPRRVRVWFGNEVICSHVAEAEQAERYARLMAQRYAGLTIMIENALDETDPQLPHELLWEQTVK